MVDYALELLSRGFLCAPVCPGGRHLDLERMGYAPLHLQTRQKRLKELCFNSVLFHFSQHPPSTDTIRMWFDGFEGNIGIIGGYQGLVILDFDHPAVYHRWKEEHEELVSSTPVTKSPHGFHVYFKTAMPMDTSSLHFGLRRAGHVKGLGGYALCAPSTLRCGGMYNWLPNQSPFDVELQGVDPLQSLSLQPIHPLKRVHDRLLNRGFFEPN